MMEEVAWSLLVEGLVHSDAPRMHAAFGPDSIFRLFDAHEGTSERVLEEHTFSFWQNLCRDCGKAGVCLL